MLHEPVHDMGVDYASKQKTKLGIILFFVYAIIYGIFVFISLNYTHILGVEVFSGLNLAIVYGMGLIMLAIIMGFGYNWLCSNMEDKMEKEAKK